MQRRIGQRAQRLVHDGLEGVRTHARAALAQGGVGERHAEVLAHALGEATGKRQRVSDEPDDDLPGLHLAPRALMRIDIARGERGAIPPQQGQDPADQIGRLSFNTCNDGDGLGWREHPFSVNHENEKYSNYSLTALGLG